MENPQEWVRKCQYYFEIHQVLENYKTMYASLYFQGTTDEWYGGYILENDPPSWIELIELVKRRFKKKGARSAIDEVKRVHQVGNVEEYIDKFERANRFID